MRRALLVLGLVLAAFATTAGTALAGNKNVGAVYVQKNSVPNAVRVFYRSADGQLTAGPIVPTGGSGSAASPPLGLGITDSANSVVLTQDNNVLLVSNSGSDTISSFRVLHDGNIALADQKWSGGDFPMSIAVTNGGPGRSLVYALNESTSGHTPNVSGFTLDKQGKLTPIPGSTRSVSGDNPAAVGFNHDGHVLTVTNRNHIFSMFLGGGAPDGSISTWTVDKSTGLLGPQVVTPAIGTGAPFGFDYTNQDELLVANNGSFEGGIGSASSYEVDKKTAAVTPRDDEVSGSVTCWVAITKNGKFGYFTSVGPPGPVSGEGSVAGFRITKDSQLDLLFIQHTQGSALDEDTSENSQYLYILSTDLNFLPGIGDFIAGLLNGVITPGTFPLTDSRVTAYKIDDHTGSLTTIGAVSAGTGGNSGLASY